MTVFLVRLGNCNTVYILTIPAGPMGVQQITTYNKAVLNNKKSLGKSFLKTLSML